MVVLSSFASVIDLSKDTRPSYTYTAKDWNPVTQEQAARDGFSGYFASKTFAERAAWEMWNEAKAKGETTWDLVTLCPPMIYGPPYHEVNKDLGVEGLNTSLKDLITGLQGHNPAFKPHVATPGLPAWVDVRDVAEAHVSALALEQGIAERFLICAGVDYLEDGLTGLRGRGEEGLGEEGARCDRAKHFRLDRGTAERALNLRFKSFEKTVEDSWEEVKRLGLL